MKTFLILSLATMSLACLAQDDDDHRFRQVYPVGDPADINYKFMQYHDSETILFEANPIVRYSIYNMIRQRLMSGETNANAFYLSFRPQLRMYNSNSKPVRTPSYRIFVGAQRVWVHDDDNLFAVAFETGHYSNGQDRGAFTEEFEDGSPESEALYMLINDDTDLSAILNRSSGNFSTNLTEVVANYRFNKLDPDTETISTWHMVKAGVTIYHDGLLYAIPIGGYSDADINLYGRARFLLGYEFMNINTSGRKWSVGANFEYITNPHPHVKRGRLEVVGTWYPWIDNEEFGVFLNFITGHDNYNFRFVDAGPQVSVGLMWSAFPAIQVSK